MRNKTRGVLEKEDQRVSGERGPEMASARAPGGIGAIVITACTREREREREGEGERERGRGIGRGGERERARERGLVYSENIIFVKSTRRHWRHCRAHQVL